jgi:hypothetical protein
MIDFAQRGLRCSQTRPEIGVELINLIEGQPICRDIVANDGDEQQMLARLSMKRRCYVAVPPLLGTLVGGLTLAYRQPLGTEAETGATQLVYQAATRIATW